MAGSDSEASAAAALLPWAEFRDPVLWALGTTQRELGQARGAAVRYRGEVAPFAALREPTAAAMRDLVALMQPAESVWVFGDQLPEAPGIRRAETLECLQMVLPDEAPTPPEMAGVVELGEAGAGEMVALTNVAFPAFFRPRTVEMGQYFGVRDATGRLLAMGGERLRMPGYAEISGLCTHPEARGQGFAAGLIGRLVRLHREEGVVSWLQVGATNRNAVALYERLGFLQARSLPLNRMLRV